MQDSMVVSVGDKQYCIWNEFQGSVDPSLFSNITAAYIPATAISTSKADFEKADLEKASKCTITQFLLDDVWNEGFTEVILQQKWEQVIVQYPNMDIIVHKAAIQSVNLPDGPYLVNMRSGKIHSVARRLKDPLHAFIGGAVVIDSIRNKYRQLNNTRYLVPSRLYYQASSEKPLSGLRFAVKDVIDVSGLVTGNGSLCWKDVHPPAEETALFVQHLTNAGAVFVGKLNCTQFCDGQDPSERFEQVTPFNPRGDGFQSPSSSSSGSASATAGYDWLDFTIGTDTGGSIRHPAGVTGTYGMRPTIGTIASKGMQASALMDTVGIFTRSAEMLQKVHSVMESSPRTIAPPRCSGQRYSILYPIRSPEEAPNDTPKWFVRPGDSSKFAEADGIFESVVTQLEGYLNCKRKIFNIDELWTSSHPESMHPNLGKATGTIYQNLVYSDLANDMIKPFIARYESEHEGRTPYLEPIFKKRIEYGASISKDQYAKARQDFETYKSWLLDVLLASRDDEMIVLVYPQSWGLPYYRDDGKFPQGTQSSEIFWEGFSSYSISYVSGCPDITVPVGQVRYYSQKSEREEWLPISMSFLSQPGNDQALCSLLKDLEEKGILRPVLTGAQTFEN